MKKAYHPAHRQKKSPQAKYLFIAFFAAIASAASGKYLVPFALPLLKRAGISQQTVLFGQTVSLDNVALAAGYAVIFLGVFFLLAFALRDRHGKNDKSGTWFVGGVATVTAVCAGVYFYLNADRTAYSAVEKQQTGYTAQDRNQLEKLIHQGAKND